MKDLAVTPDQPTDLASAATKPANGKDQKPSYPNLCLRDKHLDIFLEGGGLPNIDDTIEVEVQLRVKGVSHDEWGRRVEFDVIAMDTMADLDDDEEVDDGKESPAIKAGKKMYGKS